jgi:hypothetical protein
MEFFVPRYAFVNTGNVLSGVLPTLGGGRQMFVDHRGSDGRIHRESRTVAADTPFFILPGIGQVDEGELAEITQYAKEEGERIAREMKARKGPAPTAAQYREKFFEICERRVAEAKGVSVSGPHYSREAGF